MDSAMTYDSYLQANGIVLCDANPGDVGFTWNDTLKAIELLRIEHRALLGGDVYSTANGRIRFTYANWSISRLSSESNHDYVRRSLDESAKYVLRIGPVVPFGERKGEKSLFLLVPERTNKQRAPDV